MTQNKTCLNKALRVLVIDDDLDILTVVKYALEKDPNFCVQGLPFPENALREILQFQPDVVLLDVMMPKVDGLTLLKLIRSTQEIQDMPIILLTAKALSNEREYCQKVGAQGIIVKPFDPRTLPEQIHTILAP
jgi:DNA-binding response OmpR family regulator